MNETDDFFNINDEFENIKNDKKENIEEENQEEFEFEQNEQKITDNINSDKYVPSDYQRTPNEISDSVEELKGNISSMLDTINHPEEMFPEPDLLPGLDLAVEVYDYDKDIELIKIDSKETLECLANLYLTPDNMKNKNIYKIIKNDSDSLSDLNFSISMAKRALISCMTQLDLGVNDPLMYQSVAMFQKEMRDTIKMTYDLQKKMKEFYKELKEELVDINQGEEESEISDEDNYTIIGDPKLLNDVFDQIKDDPTLLEQMLNGTFKLKEKE